MGLDARPLGARRGLIALVAAAAFCGCADVEQPSQRPASDAPIAVQETRVRKWVEYRDGKKAWEFSGDVVRYYENPERVEADGVIIDFYDANEEYSSTLVADFGKIDRKSSNMEVTGSVVMTNVEGTRIETESLFYEDGPDKIHTDEFVTIIRGNKKITGYGLETDPGLNETLIKRDVTAVTIEAEDG